MWETVDPDGQRVVLTLDRWRHIAVEHSELGDIRKALLRTIAEPHRRIRGRVPGEEWFYRQGIGPTRWVRVVVHYGPEGGRIVTAFPRRRFP